MNFFAAQDKARGRTKLLVVMFIIAIASTIALVYLMFAGFEQAQGEQGSVSGLADLNLDLLAGVAAFVLGVVAIGSLTKSIQLSGGGSTVAESLGGSHINPTTATGQERQLLNVVEEMAIASGTPVPSVYLIPDQSINAFAAGTTISNAAIGVTEGLVAELNRDQMQGVIAHEFSHIINGDMRLNIRLTGMIHGLMIISIIGTVIMRMSAPRFHRMRRETVPFMLIGLGLAIIGAVGAFFGGWIKSAASRQREFLADASAVQFTRNPAGIAGALDKIRRIGMRGQETEEDDEGQQDEGQQKFQAHTAEFAHMFFASAAVSSLGNMFATHPPLAQRIDRIMRGEPLPPEREKIQPIESAPKATSSGLDALGSAFGVPSSAMIAAQIGAFSMMAMQQAKQMRSQLPQALWRATEDPYSARALIYAMLLDRKAQDCRQVQLEHIANNADIGVYDLVCKLKTDVDALERKSFLPLIQASFPALRELSTEQKKMFFINLTALIETDEKIEIYEWCIQATVTHVLFDGTDLLHSVGRATKKDFAYSLALLAEAGNKATASASFAAAASILDKSLKFESPDFDGDRMFKSMQRLAKLGPKKKELFVKAAIACIVSDENVDEDQYALLRTFLMSMDCPMPAAIDPDASEVKPAKA